MKKFFDGQEVVKPFLGIVKDNFLKWFVRNLGTYG